MVDRFERFSFAISEISRCWHKLAAEEMEKYGLRGPHCLYLLAMYHHPGGVTAPQLGELCGRDKADVSRMMAMMREKGLVVKESAGQTLYGGVWRLTHAGKAAAEYVCRRASLAVEMAGKEITDEKRAVFYECVVSGILPCLSILRPFGAAGSALQAAAAPCKPR